MLCREPSCVILGFCLVICLYLSDYSKQIPQPERLWERGVQGADGSFSRLPSGSLRTASQTRSKPRPMIR